MAFNFKDCARPASLADGANGALPLRVPAQDSAGGPLGLGGTPCRPRAWAARDCSQPNGSGRGSANPDLHAAIAQAPSSRDATWGTTDPAAPLAVTTNFKSCARLPSLADAANGALKLRAPSLNSGGGPRGRLENPRVRLAISGPSGARTQGAALGGAKFKPEDTAQRSLSAAASGARGLSRRPLGLVMLPAPESGVAHSCSSSFVRSCRGAVTRQGAALAATPSASVASGLTATASDNRDRSAGRLASSPTYRPASSLPARRPADLHAALAVTVSSHDAMPGITEPVPSLPSRDTLSHLSTYPGSSVGGSGGQCISSLAAALPASGVISAPHNRTVTRTTTNARATTPASPNLQVPIPSRPTGNQPGRPLTPACVALTATTLDSQEER